MFNKLKRQVAISFCATISCAAMAQATTLEFTVTNTAALGGFAFSPMYLAFHDGSFDAFDAGTAASPGLETIAETGFANRLNQERVAADPDSDRLFVLGPDFPPRPVFVPGESVTAQFDVDGAVNRFLSYFSMLTPTNDTFMGNDEPQAIALFDDLGTFQGDRVITISRADMWDAGTEVNDTSATGGSADLDGANTAEGTAENGVIHAIEDLSEFAGKLTDFAGFDGNQYVISDGILNDPDPFVGATISIRQVPAVPLPATGLLGLTGLALLGGLRRMRRKS